MNVSANFDLREFVDPITHAKFGDSSIWFVDRRLILVCQRIRELVGKSIAINNWHSGGPFKESGFRPPTETGAAMSQHKYGRAADLKFTGIAPADVLRIIEANWASLRTLGLSTVENPVSTPTWLHVDVRYTNSQDLLIVNP